MKCKRCEERGKTWNGDDPVCGFDENGNFISHNWNCDTLNALRNREKFEDEFKYNGCDETCLIHPVYDETFIVLSWYKNRGRLSTAKQIDSGGVEPLTLQMAELFLDNCS